MFIGRRKEREAAKKDILKYFPFRPAVPVPVFSRPTNDNYLKSDDNGLYNDENRLAFTIERFNRQLGSSKETRNNPRDNSPELGFPEPRFGKLTRRLRAASTTNEVKERDI